MVDAPVEIEHVHHVAAHDAVDQVAHDAAVEQHLGHDAETAGGEDGLALPEKEGEREHGEHGKRPHMPLQHPPRASPVLHVREVEEVVEHDARGLPLQRNDGRRLHDLIHEEQVHDDGEGDNESPQHQRVPKGFSIAVWHSMHVCTKGRFSRRGLRMSWPQTSQMP